MVILIIKAIDEPQAQMSQSRISQSIETGFVSESQRIYQQIALPIANSFALKGYVPASGAELAREVVSHLRNLPQSPIVTGFREYLENADGRSRIMDQLLSARTYSPFVENPKEFVASCIFFAYADYASTRCILSNSSILLSSPTPTNFHEISLRPGVSIRTTTSEALSDRLSITREILIPTARQITNNGVHISSFAEFKRGLLSALRTTSHSNTADLVGLPSGQLVDGDVIQGFSSYLQNQFASMRLDLILDMINLTFPNRSPLDRINTLAWFGFNDFLSRRSAIRIRELPLE